MATRKHGKIHIAETINKIQQMYPNTFPPNAESFPRKLGETEQARDNRLELLCKSLKVEPVYYGDLK